MAGIDFATSIMTVIQLGELVLVKSYQFGTMLAYVKTDMKNISVELEDINATFKQLGAIKTGAESKALDLTKWPELVALNVPLSTCITDLKELFDELKP